jgi:hypothetical protein
MRRQDENSHRPERALEVFMPEFHIASRPMDRLMRSCKAQWFDFATLTKFTGSIGAS